MKSIIFTKSFEKSSTFLKKKTVDDFAKADIPSDTAYPLKQHEKLACEIFCFVLFMKLKKPQIICQISNQLKLKKRGVSGITLFNTSSNSFLMLICQGNSHLSEIDKTNHICTGKI